MNKTINKFFLILLSISFIFCMVACDNNDNSLSGGNGHSLNEINYDVEDSNLLFFSDSFTLEYKKIIEPIENAALFIIKDLFLKDKLSYNLRDLGNPKLQSIRFCYGNSIHITIVGDQKAKDGNTSNYLKESFIFMLDGIGEHYSSEYAIAQEFFKQERLLTGKQNYVSVVKPLAQNTANAILSLYNNYIGQIECQPSGEGESIFINANNTSYNLIQTFLNEKIKENKSSTHEDGSYQNMINKMPLLNDCKINISFGGVNGKINGCTFTVSMGMSDLLFKFDIDVSSEYYNEIAYFCGLVEFGYWPGPDWQSPNDSEYLSFFTDLINNLPQQCKISSDYKMIYGEDTIMNLPYTPIDILS